MNDFKRCKVTGVRWLKKPVKEMKIHVKLKSQDSILLLPKFEEYTNETNGLNNVNIDSLKNKVKEFTFRWQEKVFSAWELQRYSDVHNCLTEIELQYQEMINKEDCEASKVFTYIHEDYRFPLPSNFYERNKNNEMRLLTSCFQGLKLNDNIGELVNQIRNRMMVLDTSSMSHLFKSSENIVEEDEEWTAMHVVFDNSEYNEDSQLLLKQECVLVSIYHNRTHNYLMISPDVNSFEQNPYAIESESAVPLGYQYTVDIEFETAENGEELVTLLRKLLKKWERQQKQMLNFEMPAIGMKQYFISLEMIKARDFETDDLYVEYNVKLPEGVECKDDLHGRTHVARSATVDTKEYWNFGHLIELNLEASVGSEIKIQVFIEVISTDWWGRHRTEGYCYLPLTPEPGHYTKRLSCSRPEEMNPVEADSRRFFVGGCHLINDLEILAKPQLSNSEIRFVTTGYLFLRWNVLTQNAMPGSLSRSEHYGTNSATALLLGAEAVLRHYRKARARLAEATKGVRGDTTG